MSRELEENLEEQRPIKQTFCSSIRRDTHWKCLILTLLIHGCLAAIIWCRFTVVTKVFLNFESFPVPAFGEGSPCDDGYIYVPIAFVVMLYLVYLVECWHCHTRIELQYKVDINTVYERIQQMREALPVVWWKAICYHYVRRTRQVTRYRDGDAFTTTQVYYERVNSHSAGAAFVFTHCGVKDISKKLIGLEDCPATKIRFTKGFAFANIESANEFEDQRTRFFQENERRDDYMEMREGLDLMNVHFKEYMIAFADPDNLPWYVSHLIFWIASLLVLSWPLRVLIEYKTAYVHYQVTKLFGTNYLTPTSNIYTPGQLSRVSTVESTEFEMNLRNNYSIVPSYSEALLMETDSPCSRLQDSNANITLNGDITHTFHNGQLQNGNHVSGIIPRINRSISHILLQNGPRRGYSISHSNQRQRHGCSQSENHNGRTFMGSRFSLQNGHLSTGRTSQLASTPEENETGLVQQLNNRVEREEVPPPAYDDVVQINLPPLLAQMRRSQTDRDITRHHLPEHRFSYNEQEAERFRLMETSL